MSECKATGTYYPPEKIVRALIDDAFGNEKQTAGKRILDPCCGTGNFLLQLPPEIPPESIHGSDIDETSVLIARISLALKFRGCDASLLRENITVRDSLEDDGRECSDLVIGNPPWGFDYPESEKEHLRERFRTASGKCMESYDLFIEQAFRNLRDGGRLAFVLPEAALSVKAHRPVREEIMKSGRIASVRYLGNVFDRV